MIVLFRLFILILALFPAVSAKQQKFMGAELGRKKAGKKTQTGMSADQLADFAKKPKKKPGRGQHTGDHEDSTTMAKKSPSRVNEKHVGPPLKKVSKKPLGTGQAIKGRVKKHVGTGQSVGRGENGPVRDAWGQAPTSTDSMTMSGKVQGPPTPSQAAQTGRAPASRPPVRDDYSTNWQGFGGRVEPTPQNTPPMNPAPNPMRPQPLGIGENMPPGMQPGPIPGMPPPNPLLDPSMSAGMSAMGANMRRPMAPMGPGSTPNPMGPGSMPPGGPMGAGPNPLGPPPMRPPKTQPDRPVNKKPKKKPAKRANR